MIYLYAIDQSKRIDQLQCIINALIRVLSFIRIFSSAFYPPSAFYHPCFILRLHFLIRIFSSAIRIRHPYPPSVSAFYPYPKIIIPFKIIPLFAWAKVSLTRWPETHLYPRTSTLLLNLQYNDKCATVVTARRP